jgi:hypothetical protein
MTGVKPDPELAVVTPDPSLLLAGGAGAVGVASVSEDMRDPAREPVRE